MSEEKGHEMHHYCGAGVECGVRDFDEEFVCFFGVTHGGVGDEVEDLGGCAFGDMCPGMHVGRNFGWHFDGWVYDILRGRRGPVR